MAETEMVEVVIKMPKEKYDSICNMYGTFPTEMKEWGLEYIKNGTVLPEGHERLIEQPTDTDIAETIGGQNDFADCIREAVATVFEKQNKENIMPYITGATLLSVEEAKNLDKEILKADKDWWLRSPAHYANYATCVGGDSGCVYIAGSNVKGNFGVRPALKLSNLESSNLQIWDKFTFGNHDFTIISDCYALCNDCVGRCTFRKDSEAENANKYEASDIKGYVEAWFEKVKEQSLEERDSEEEREI